MSWIDWILVGVYLLGLVVLGVKLGKTNKTEKDYFLGEEILNGGPSVYRLLQPRSVP